MKHVTEKRSMNDFISRAAAIEALKRAAYWQDAERKIAELPAVDAAPVVHGRWKVVINPFWDAECSECGYKKRINWEWRFCPYCGAKMDEEQREAAP